MRTANLAIVFTDIKGFTERTSQQTLDENQRLLDLHARLVGALFSPFGGRVVKTIGDAYLATFESPTQAVLCGVAIQDRLWLHNRRAPEAERLSVRVAINVGEVRVEGSDVFGEPVNIASRVEGIAEAGEVYFTEAVYLSMNKAEVPAEEVGAFELKGIPGKIRVLRVPHGPYRMASETGSADGTPPFGNLGLAKLEESTRRPSAEIAQAALAQTASTASALVDKVKEVADGAWRRLGPALGELRALEVMRRSPLRSAGAAGLAILLCVALWVGTRSEVEAAIDAVASAKGAEQERRVERAERLIGQEKKLADRAFYEALLAEARGEPADAAGYLATAHRKGSSRARGRLLDLLEHESCAARSKAAYALADLKLRNARGALEDLAEDGGPGDAEGGGSGLARLFAGCNSKSAAKRALEQLGE